MDPKIKVTLVGTAINLVLPPLKFIVGLLGHSSALIADAVHSLSDLLSDLIVYLFLSISNKSRDEDHDYGHGRFETIATLFISLILVGVAGAIVWNTIHALYLYFSAGILPPTPSIITLWVIILSIILKEVVFRLTRRVALQTRCNAIMANAWHHRSDAYSSIATLIGVGGAIGIGNAGRLLEPLSAFIVAIFILKVALQIGIPALQELSDKHLGADIEENILTLIQTVPGVRDPHNLRTRRIGPNYAIEVDIRVDGLMTVEHAHNLTMCIEQKLRQAYGERTHIVIHVEPLNAPYHGIQE